jgi:Flp pilus assembly protein TadD
MKFELTESNRQGMSGTAVILGLIVVGSVVAFGCSGGDDPSSIRQTRETPVRPASITTERPTVKPAVTDVPVAGTVVEAVVPPKTVVPANVSFADGEAAYRARDYDRATVLFEAYVERKPSNAWGHFMLGLSARKSGDFSLAVEAFDEALSLDPNHVKSHFNLGRTLLDIGEPELALAEFEAGLELEPEVAEGYRLIGRAYQELGDTDSALEAYREALVLDEQDAWSMNNMGLLLIRGSRSADAIGPLARAGQLRDDLAVVRNNLGIALELTGHFDQAAQAYRDALTIDAGYQKAAENLERVSAVQGGPGQEPIDLDRAAQEFGDRIAKWRSPDISEFVPEFDSLPIVRDTVDEVEVGGWE